MKSDIDILVLENLKKTGIPMTLTVYDCPMKKRMLLGYEIDNSLLKTKDAAEVIPLIDRVEVIELRFYLNHHLGWFYDRTFLPRHTMAEYISIYINNFKDDYIIAMARDIINYKPLKEIRIINTMRKHSQILHSTFGLPIG